MIMSEQLLREFFPLDGNVVTIFGEFTILWQLFEKEYCNKMCQIKKLKKIANSASKTDHDGALTQAIADFRIGVTKWATPNFEINLNNVQERFRFETNTLTQKDLAQKAVDFLSNSEQDFTKQVHGALLVLHRLRNNLLHGEKEKSTLYLQADMFSCATKVLFALHKLKCPLN